MSDPRIEFEKIDSIMHEGDIAGISFATVDHAGKVNPKVRGFKRYDLELMTADSNAERKPERFYLNPTPEGLEYEVIGINNEIVRATIAWAKLPKDFPQEASEIMGKKYLTLPVIQKLAQEAGHVQRVTAETIFRAASLSKPVFAYLVLRLIEDNKSNDKVGLGKFILPENLKEFNLDTPLWKVFPEMLSKFDDDKETQDRAKALTARHVLSHTTGLPLKSFVEGEKLKFQFKPGKEYGYSNLGIALLQDVVDKITGSNLRDLAKANVFDDPEMKMTSSSFNPEPGGAAHSLHTTATDYAHFIAGWLRNDKLRELAFSSQIDMEDDRWAIGQGLSDEARKKVAWGLGIGLQLNSKGKVIGAFHPGDMDQWRAFVAINLEKREGIVYLANTPNGLLLVDTIIKPNIEISDGLNYVFEKFGFARIIEDDWKKKQIERITTIITKYELHLSVDGNENLFTMSMKCAPFFFDEFVAMIKNQLDEFKKHHHLKETECVFNIEKDVKGNVISVSIELPSVEKYNQFSEQLKAANLLPIQDHIGKYDLARSAFGQGSDTAKLHASTHAMLMNKGVVKKAKAKATPVSSDRRVVKEEPAKKEKAESKVTDLSDRPDIEVSQKPRTPFDAVKTGPQPTGRKGSRD